MKAYEEGVRTRDPHFYVWFGVERMVHIYVCLRNFILYGDVDIATGCTGVVLVENAMASCCVVFW
jgi:hypothetical protein